MATKLEYAALSAFVYNDQRGGGVVDTPTNKLILPPGWTSLSELGFTAGDYLNINPFSATAGAYLNQSTGEIVVAYKGTDFLTGAEARSINTVLDLTADVGLGIARAQINVPAQLYASSYYAAVKDWAATNGYSDTKISFTGHSLGGGLASMMSVWFDRPATTFAQGPFGLAAINRASMVTTIATLTAQAAVSGSLAVLDAVNSLRQLFLSMPSSLSEGQSSVYDTRLPAVTNYYNKGEFLEYLRAVWPTVIGAGKDNAIDIGDRPFDIGRGLALHSMNLHAAFLYDDRLRNLAKTMPELVPALLNPALYFADPNSTTKDLITTLVNDQLRQGFSADSALKRFTSDLMKLQGESGMAAQPSIRTGLIAAAMEYYYFKEPTSTTALFSTEGNAIHFKYSDIGATNYKSLPLLAKAIQPFLDSGENKVAGLGQLIAQNAWHIQSGTSGMNWTASDSNNDAVIGGAQTDIIDAGAGNDIVIGGAGRDFLNGGAGNDSLLGGVDVDVLDGGEGNDQLYGGAGDDILSGGAGNDNLQGGADIDTYQFDAAWGKDVITDSDGKGTITIGGQTLGTAKGGGQTNVWVTELGAGSGQFVGMAVYDDASSSTGKKLIITKGADTSNTIIINNFDLAAATGGQGYLGIKLDKTQHIALTQGNGTTQGASTPNVYAYQNFNPSSLVGKNTQFNEGNGASFTVSLAVGAKAGDTVRLAVNGGLAGKRACARRVFKASRCYELDSCLRTISLGCRPKMHIKSAAAAPTREAPL